MGANESATDAGKALRDVCLADLKGKSYEDDNEAQRRTQQSCSLLKLPLTSPLTVHSRSGKWKRGEKWEAGTILHVKFLGGSEEDHEAVKKFAPEWSKYANVGFQFSDSVEETEQQLREQRSGVQWEIRVGFDEAGGNWSAVGKDALNFSKDKATMNLILGSCNRGRQRGIILHQFGHVLGLTHEHKPPAAGLKWRKAAVWKALCSSAIHKDAIEDFFFQTLDECHTNYEHEFELNSIMRCPIPREWMMDPKHISTIIEKLCTQDIQYIGYEYPGARVSFENQELQMFNCEVFHDEYTQYNYDYHRSWRLLHPGESFIIVTFNQVTDTLRKGRYNKVTLKLIHLTSYGGPQARPDSSPVNFLVNGAPPKGANYSPPSNDYYLDEIDITGQIRDGKNEIMLQLQQEAQTHYWIQWLKVTYI